MIPIIVYTNDNHLWLLRGFSYLWNKYSDNHRVTVAGFNQPDFALPKNFRFYSLGEQLPAERWSNGLIKLINDFDCKHFILLLEDFWLFDHVDCRIFNILPRVMTDDTLRIDLSGNRASYKQAQAIGSINSYKLVETKAGTPYQMSFQAALWDSKNLLSVLRENENPWKAEVEGSGRVGDLRVFGTRPAIIKYQPVWRTKQRRWQLEKMKTDDLEYMRKAGWLND